MTERIAVFSDTHGNRAAVLAAVPVLRSLKPTRIVFLGDGMGDLAILNAELSDCPPIDEVCGNVDAGGDLTRVIECDGVRIFATHGHRYHVKEGTGTLLYAAEEAQCTVALYGHTHVPNVERIGGLLLLNPGSMSRAFDRVPRFALLSVEKGRAEGYLMQV